MAEGRSGRTSKRPRRDELVDPCLISFEDEDSGPEEGLSVLDQRAPDPEYCKTETLIKFRLTSNSVPWTERIVIVITKEKGELIRCSVMVN